MKKVNWISSRTSVSNIGYHFVWSTKYRREILISPIDVRLKELLLEIAADYHFSIETLEIMPYHCHLFVVGHPKLSPSVLIRLLKGVTSRKLFLEFPKLGIQLWAGHLWNPSYYVGTVGAITKEVVKRYIEDQKQNDTNR